MFDPAVDKALQALTDQIESKFPEAKEILQDLRDGKVDQMVALQKLMAIPGIASNIEGMATESFAPLHDPGVVHPNSGVPVTGGEAPPAIYQETGLPRLNPLVEAAIMEQSQFDGDVPQFRTGPLPEGATPAVPVETDARDPVAIGKMLETASSEVAGELRVADKGFVEEAQQITYELVEEGADEERSIERIKAQLPMRPVGVEGYEAGSVPSLRKVEEPSGSALACLSTEERQQAAWKALSTSQGRRSARGVVEELIRVGLASEGYEMDARPATMGIEGVEVYAQWSVSIAGGAGTQSNFSFIDTAAKAMLRKLVPLLEKHPLKDPVLEVTTVDTVDVRRVGFAARIVGRSEGTCLEP